MQNPNGDRTVRGDRGQLVDMSVDGLFRCYASCRSWTRLPVGGYIDHEILCAGNGLT